MARMDDERLLTQLQALEQDSADFVWGVLGKEREKAMREYSRAPYGNEEPGWSSIVTSDVQDTVEWVLPALLKVFTSTDRAVSFDPTRAEDVEGADQATDACNYVFYKQNNGFLVLYTAIKDALSVKNGAVMWRKEKKRVKEVTPVKGASPEMLAMVLQEAGEDAEIESATPSKPQPMMGPQGPMVDPMTGQPMMAPPTFDARLCSYKEKTSIRIEAFPPEDLLVKRDWTSPLLDDCPYVARVMRITLSDLHEMGHKDVTAEDLAGSDDVTSADADFRAQRAGDIIRRDTEIEDESLTEGTLRIEFVLIDYDGDGIAERRCIYRLKDKILSNEECAQVPIATASPILNQHRWDGMSLAEVMSDLQALNTELTRQMLNSAYLANNPRTKVLTDSNGAPRANIDDLLDNRPGGILRQYQVDAIQEHVTPWSGGQMFPMLEHVQRMGERRTGVSPSQQMDPNAIKGDRTAIEVQQTANAAAARVELVARIFAELLLKPIFKGVLKLLTEGEMEKIAFRLRNEFVEYDPNEWRDSYDMTINVGLGTGDKQQQGALLQAIFQQQGAIAASPMGALLVKPKTIYHTLSKIVENAGFKNVGDFWVDPGDQPIPQQPPPPDPSIQIAQMKLQGDAQRIQYESQRDQQLESLRAQAKLQEVQANLELQAANDARDSERETLKAHYEAQLAAQQLELDRYKTDRDNETRIQVALINQQGKLQAAANRPAPETPQA
jgi:hypothetical protein